MTQPAQYDPTAFIQFTKDDATSMWIRRDWIAGFSPDSKASYRTVLHLQDGTTMNVAHAPIAVVQMCGQSGQGS